MEKLQQRLGHHFASNELLEQALTHKSFANEHRAEGVADNERLEFLGDAVLDLVVSEALHSHQPALNEGEMTRARAEVVSEKGLSALARRMGVGQHLRLGRGEELTGGRDKDSLLADATEALFGAVFCDAGFRAARLVVGGLLEDAVAEAIATRAGLDAKTRLQELLQARQGQLPRYVLVDTQGPDHDRSYLVEVRVEGETIASGRGRTKKQAEQQAAGKALRQLDS